MEASNLDAPSRRIIILFARCTLLAQVPGPMLSRVTWAMLKLLVSDKYDKA